MRRCGRKNHSVLKGAVAGTVGGLIGSWAMNQFQAFSAQVAEAWKKSARSAQTSRQPNESEDATMKTADRLAQAILHRHLTMEEKKKAGPVVHYAYGALLGAVYGALAEEIRAVNVGDGAAYASAVFLVGDEIVIPKLGLSEPPEQYPLKVHINAFASHLVYGVTTEAVRRTVRAIV